MKSKYVRIKNKTISKIEIYEINLFSVRPQLNLWLEDHPSPALDFWMSETSAGNAVTILDEAVRLIEGGDDKDSKVDR